MGGLEVSNKSMRCEKCFEIKRMTIIPEYPEPKLKMECRCDDKETKLFEFLTEFKKKENFKVKCAKCQSDNPKEPKYCYTCQKIYCVKCLDFHSQLSNLSTEQKEGENNNNSDVMNLIGHKVIGVEKVDFYCILHENEKFTGFCKKCLLNFCQKCQEENLHKDHEIALFSEILLDDKKKQIIKGCIALSHEKIEHNEKICKKIKKKIKNEENKNLINTLSKENKKINEKIIEYFETMFEMYEKLKHKNYSIIFNARKNTKFNKDVIKLDKKDKDIEEEDGVALIEYLKNDFILHTDYSLKKKGERKEEQQNIMASINDNIEANDDEKKEKEKEDEEIFKNLIKDDVKIEEEKKEEKKEEKVEEKKEEKIEEKKEEKKEETKKEKKEREKKEKEEKARKEKEEKERLKKEEKEKKEHEKKEKEEKARKEKEEKERLKKEEKEKKEHDKKEKEEKARKEKEEKERLKKEEKEKKEHDKKDKEKKDDKKKEEKKDDKKKEEKKDDKKGPSNNKINEKSALFKQMMEAKGGGMIGRPGTYGPGPRGNTNNEPAIKIEHTRNEGNTVDLLNNIKVSKTVKKKPKKINFE